MSAYAIGDIQGCYEELMRLLDLVRFDPAADSLWLVGDLVNRGPDNCEVLDCLLSLPRVTAVLGNHDLHFMAVATGMARPHDDDTLEDLLASPRLDDYLAWLRQLPLLHYDEGAGLLMVHAGLPPQLPLARILALAKEVEARLRGPGWQGFLKAMYGNKPARFKESLTGKKRLRVIANYLTRLRYCTAKGRMNLTHKGGAAPPGHAPWFAYPREEEVHVLFGHWAALDGDTGDATWASALDTGCVWGRSLTALRLDDGRRFAVPAI